MSANILIRKVFPIITVCALLLSSCQVFNLLWPKDGPVDIAEVLPDEAEIEALEEEIEKMEEELEAVATEIEPNATVYPLTSSFTLNYNFKAESPAFLGTASETQRVEFVGSVETDPDLPSYPITKTFTGSQYTVVEGLKGGVPCQVKLKSDVKYLLFGQFLPKTCEFQLVLDADLEDMNIVENNCIEYANILENFATFFIPPPDVTFTVTRAGEEVFLDQYHSVSLSDIQLGYPITCKLP